MSVRGESREAGRRNLGGVLFELHQHLVDISVGRELDHDFELLHLHLPVVARNGMSRPRVAGGAGGD